jgi:RNA polymerase-binding transcription factor DksA
MGPKRGRAQYTSWMPSEAVLAAIKSDLEREQTSLHEQLTELGFAEQDDTGLEYDSNFADTSQVTAERSEAATLAGKLREHLADVELALHKLEDGTYGACENCNTEIPEARLEAIPAGRLCMNCATAKH